MSNYRFPSVFLSHGTPMLAFGEDSYQRSLHEFSTLIQKPKAVLFVSAHSLSSDQVHVLRVSQNEIQHDFMGFPEELYQIQYQCPGDPALADQTSELLRQAGFKVKLETQAPLDHGIWVPLLHLYPKGDVPVIRISLPINLLPAQILKMGHTLASLREQGVLLIASGGAVHNLRELQWSKKNSAGAEWAQLFENWVLECLKTKNVEDLMNYEEHPLFFKAHPSEEHFLPVLFSVGATLPGDEVSVIFKGIEYETISMLCFALNQPQKTVFH